mgnify:CR=1 FL=1
MAVTPVHELAMPTEFTSFFLNDEKALSVHPTLSDAPARTTYYVSKWMPFLEGGEYLIRCVAEDASLWLSTQERDNSRSIYFTKRDSGPQEATIFLPRGRQRFDLVLTNVSDVANAESRCFFAFSLWKTGKLIYSSAGAGWVFGTEVIPEADVPALGDWRLDLPVFSVLPNWANPVIERLSYSTEVILSEIGVEQRRALRMQPRRSFEAMFARHDAIRSRLQNFFVGVGKNQCLVPLWHEQFALAGALGSTLVFPSESIAKREFRSGGLCLAIGKNPAVYEVLLVDEVDYDTDTISFVSPPVSDWGIGDRLIPLLVARVLDVPSLGNPTDRVGQVSVRFTIDDSEPFPFVPSWGHCSPLFRFAVNRGTDITVGYERVTAFVEDGDTGPLDVYDPEQRDRITIRAGMQLRGRDDVVAFKQFIDMARGRAIRFWMPTFTADMQAVATIDGTVIDVRSAGFFDYLKSRQGFKAYLAIEYLDGRATMYREIDGFAKIDDSTDRVILKTEVSDSPVASIRRISFLLPVRFDHDAFELHHLVDDSAAVLTNFSVRSADANEMEPIECGATSTIYPLEMIDGVGNNFSTYAAQLWKLKPHALDNVFEVMSMLLTGSAIVSRMADEGVSFTFTVETASLIHTVNYLETDMLPEGAALSFVVDSFTLVGAGITQVMLPDKFDLGFQVTSATLV